MLRAISSGNRVDEKSGVQHTSTPFYNAFYFQQTEQASIKQLLGFALEGGRGCLRTCWRRWFYDRLLEGGNRSNSS